MKKLYFSLALLLVSLIMSGCGNRITGKKDFREDLPDPDKIVFECQGAEFFSDRDFIRARGTGNSTNEANSMRMARSDAVLNLALAIESYHKKISDYKDRKQLQKEAAAFEWEDDDVIRKKLDMTLTGAATVCSETIPDDGRYTTHTIIELPMLQVLKLRD